MQAELVPTDARLDYAKAVTLAYEQRADGTITMH